MEYKLSRSRRKTIAIHIFDGVVDVRAPLKMPLKDIENFISIKKKWINKHLSRTGLQKQERDDFKVDYGDTVFITGKPCVIKESLFSLQLMPYENELHIKYGKTPDEIKSECIKSYKTLAKGYLIPKTIEYANRMGLEKPFIKINSAKSRWGSCTSNKTINYSWRLIMADEEAIDYVIIHELVHLIEMNHSKRFWSVVEKFSPQYKECKKRLKDLQLKLSGENWD